MGPAVAASIEESVRRGTPVAAPPEQRAGVRALARELLAMHRNKPESPKCQLIGPQGKSIDLPEAVFYALERIAEILAKGDSVAVVHLGQKITTQQAADVLNVSRQYLVRLLGQGRIPFTKTGKHRRLLMADVLAFKEERDGERRAGLRELTELTEDFGGYDKELK